jgi:hypothetical protein
MASGPTPVESNRSTGIGQALRSPAAIHHELGAATAIDPYAGTVPTPAAALGAACTRQLPNHLDLAVTTDIDLAHLVTLSMAGTRQTDPPIPTRVRAPAIIPSTVPRATAIIGTVAAGPVVTRLHEQAATTTIHPQALSIHAPTLAAYASALGLLLRQIRITPWHGATAEPAAGAFAADGLPTLRMSHWRH